MGVVAIISMLVSLWATYGGDVLIATQIISELVTLDKTLGNKTIINDIEAIFSKHNLQLSDVANTITYATLGAVNSDPDTWPGHGGIGGGGH
jgi:hypothetical protein